MSICILDMYINTILILWREGKLGELVLGRRVMEFRNITIKVNK